MISSETKSIPFWSMLSQPRPEQERLTDLFFETSINVRTLITSPRTGAFLRGVAKTHNLDATLTSLIAFAVLRIALGELPLPQLSKTLMAELTLPEDKALKMAQEIEKELFAPVMLELNQYLTQQRAQRQGKPATSTTSLPAALAPTPAASSLRNVVDLKQTKPVVPPPRPPLTTPLPPRPVSPPPEPPYYPKPPTTHI